MLLGNSIYVHTYDERAIECWLQCLGSTFSPPIQVKPSWLGGLVGIFYMGNSTARLQAAGRLVGRKADGRCYRTKFENYTATS